MGKQRSITKVELYDVRTGHPEEKQLRLRFLEELTGLLKERRPEALHQWMLPGFSAASWTKQLNLISIETDEPAEWVINWVELNLRYGPYSPSKSIIFEQGGYSRAENNIILPGLFTYAPLQTTAAEFRATVLKQLAEKLDQEIERVNQEHLSTRNRNGSPRYASASSGIVMDHDTQHFAWAIRYLVLNDKCKHIDPDPARERTIRAGIQKTLRLLKLKCR